MIEAVRNGWLVVPSTSGPVAQLGARFHGMEEVVGSIPTRSTKCLVPFRIRPAPRQISTDAHKKAADRWSHAAAFAMEANV